MTRFHRFAAWGAVGLVALAGCGRSETSAESTAVAAVPAQVQQSLSAGALSDPDLVVTALSGPPSAMPGGPLSPTATVCNQGSMGSPPTEVNVYLSSDDAITTSDEYAGWAPIPPLGAGQCASVEVASFANVPGPGAYFLGAIVDPWGSVPESNEGNNALAGGQLAVGFGPDLVIASVSAPPTAFPWSNLDLTVTVCNQGTSGGNGEFQIVLSPDDTITAADSYVASGYAGYLLAGQCATRAVTMGSSVPLGTYFIGAIADPNAWEPELIETNNAKAGNLVGIGFGADYVIRAVTGPSSASPGSGVSGTVTVCNQGEGSFSSVDVGVYLSEDETITPADSLVGSAFVWGLQRGGCATVPYSGSAVVPNGVYYLGAIADPNNFEPEVIETNNAKAGGRVGVGSGPDFVVTAVSGPTSANGPFDVAVTVCNQGTSWGTSGITVVLSRDAEISAADSVVGWDFSGSLWPGDCATRVIIADAYSVPNGAYVLGAIADADNAQTELQETNNARAGQAISVGPGPDLVVSAVSAPPSAMPGGSFQASLSVCNQGSAQSWSTSIDVFLSLDATITPVDTWIGNTWVPPLAAGECTSVSTPVGASVPNPGAYVIGAIVDPFNNLSELSEANNARAGGTVNVGYDADLVVTAVSGPPSVTPSSAFTSTVTVCNQGTSSRFAEVKVYLSGDATISSWDLSVGQAAFGSLMPGECRTQAVPCTAGMYSGAYVLGAIVDPEHMQLELDVTNNAKAGAPIGVGNAPDFVVTALSAPPSVTPGGSLNVSVTICNQGTQPGGTPIQIVASRDEDITSEDVLVAFTSTQGINPGGCVVQTVVGTVNGPDGVYRLGAIADPFNSIIETIETNNTTAGGQLGVGYRPDFVVTEISGPPSVNSGGQLATTVTVCNQGTSGGSTEVRVVLSADAIISPSDVLVQSEPLPWMEAGSCVVRTLTTNVWLMDGTYYLGAIADPFNSVPELIDTNNSIAGGQLGVGSRPDLVVTALRGPPSVLPGNGFQAFATVCNQGTTSSWSANLHLFLSADRSIELGDWFAGSAPVPHLDAGQCSVIEVSGYSTVPSFGAYVLGAIVDPYNSVSELIESNNSKAGELLGVGNNADLVVSAVSGPPSVLPGGGFTTTVRVCNQGQSYAPAEVRVVLSGDATITATDFLAGQAPFGSLAAGECRTQTIPSNAGVPDGAYYLGAIVDPYDSEPELIESNNTGVGGQLGVGARADFVVSAVSGPPSITPWSSFTATVTVCNQGTVARPAEARVVVSADADIGLGDPFLGNVYLGYLAPGDCSTGTVSGAFGGSNGAYYLGAIADPYDSELELIETNNAKAGSQLGVGNAPDFVVTAVTGPASVEPWSGFTARVTVCNQGTGGGSPDVQLYLSADPDITSWDTPAGTAGFPFMAAGACATRDVPANANVMDGVYVLGAIADPFGWTPELIETNNAKAGSELGVGLRPDLVVSAVTGAPSVQLGGSFLATATVCNQGTAPSSGSDVAFLLSADAIIERTEPLSGGQAVPPLAPGECATVSNTIPANVTAPGAYYFGAYADAFLNTPELVETNNSAVAAELMGVGFEPDFIVTAVSAPPSLTPGTPFEATVTVCNQGTDFGFADVQVVLSMDPNVSPSDFFAGQAPIGTLAPGECRTRTVPCGGPGPDGAYYVIAVADRDNWEPELIESNNTRVGPQLGVGFKPDFIVSDVSGPPSALPGVPFPATVTVCNQGTQARPTDVQLYASTDAIVGTDDIPIGFLPLGNIDTGGCVTGTVTASIGAPEGVYFLLAVADRDNWQPELIETNNAKAGSQIGIGFGPDFVVSEVSGPPSATPGSSFSARVTVCNQGTQPGAGDVRVYLSPDAAITTSDAPVGGLPFPNLAAGACATLDVPSNASVAEGVYSLGAIADPDRFVTELIEANNARAGAQLGIGIRPDLVVTAVMGPPSARPNDPLQVRATICNQGTAPSPGSDVAFLFSADAVIERTEPLSGGQSVPPLAPGECATVGNTIPVNVPGPGAYYLGAYVDAFLNLPELIESNNAKAGELMGVGNGADFIVRAVSGPPSVTPGSPILVTVTVCNQGTDGGSTAVQVHLSPDAAITSSDFVVGMVPVGFLAAGQCATQTLSGSASVPDGTYFLGAIADPANFNPELIESNNTKVGGQLGVGFKADFIVSAVSGPPSVVPGGWLSATVTVCNQGTSTASTDAQLYLSPDATITPADAFLGSVFLGSLSPGACTTVPVAGGVNVPQGAYFLGAIADPSNLEPEFIESNNTLAGGQLGVGNGPDFIVKDVSGPPSATPGASFTAQVTVCNQGTAPGAADVRVVLSPDPAITAADPSAGMVPFPSLAAGECAAVSVPSAANVPDGVYVLGAVADPNNLQPELLEANNAKAGAELGIGFKSDLVVTAVSGPPSSQQGSPGFTAAVTVCNQGQAPSGGRDVQVFLSSDDVITQADSFQGMNPVPPLAPGQCQTVNVPVFPSVPADGAYFLGAIVDVPNAEPELIETNNARAGTLMGIGFGADLVVTSLSAPPSALQSATFNATVRVCNQGTAGSGPSSLELYLSVDGNVTRSDFFAGSGSVAPLAPGQCADTALPARTDVPLGGFVLGAIVDPSGSQPELIEANNTFTGDSLLVGNGADLVVSALTSGAAVAPNGTLPVQVTLCNRGTAPSHGTVMVDLFLSTDETITPQDRPLGSVPFPVLAIGRCLTVSVNMIASVPAGAYTLGGIADLPNAEQELSETNNTLAAGRVGVGSQPDFVVTAVGGPASVNQGGVFNASVTLCNRGTTAAATSVDVFLSTDETITPADFRAGGAPYTTLGAGLCSTKTITLSASLPAGAYYLGAVADPGNTAPELSETNNAFLARPFGVGLGPDLIVTAATAPGAVSPGASFITNVGVCNQGTDYSPPFSLDVYLSSDSTITAADFKVGSASVGSLSPGQCQSLSVPSSVSAPPGRYTVGAIADAANAVYELVEVNNAKAGGLVGIGMLPDLIVNSVSTTTSSVRPNAPFTVTVQVCNVGTASSSSVGVDVMLSTDTTITSIDTAIGGQSFPPLGAGQCSSQPISVTAGAQDGTYTVGAIVNPGNFIVELLDANNARAGGSVRIDSVPPSPPTFTSTTPASPGNSTTPTLNGNAEASASVRLFSNASCTGTSLGTGTANSSGAFAVVSSTLPVGSTTSFFGTATDAAGNVSACSTSSITYRQQCAAGFASCDGNAANGCETDIRSNLNNCGGCGIACGGAPNATPFCSNSACGLTCNAGFSNCDGTMANGCETSGACPAPCSVDMPRELMITALSVVEDPVRTAGMGAWSFGRLMTDMSGTQDPPVFVRRWLGTWLAPQAVNGFTVPPRSSIQSLVIGPWEAASGGTRLDLAKAPFRLLAIVNRIDLRNLPNNAGEGRFVYGVLDGAGNPTQFTVIFEYKLPGTTAADVTQWANDWHALGQIPFSDPNFNVRLEALTRRFTNPNAMAGAPNGSALGQLRTNEIALAGPWQLREFRIGTSGFLEPVTMKQTPDLGFNNGQRVADFINQNQAAVLSETHVVPDVFQGAPFVAGAADTPPGLFWNGPPGAVSNNDARHKFSLNTCNGCHAGETGTAFLHVSPRSAGSQASLSGFLTGTTVSDPVSGVSRSFNDLARRKTDLESLVCSGGQGLKESLESFSSASAPEVTSNLPPSRVH